MIRNIGTRQTIRLTRRPLADLALWLASDPDVLDAVHIEVVASSGFVDLLGAARLGADVLLWITHRAADYPQTRRCVISAEDALLLADWIVEWDAQHPDGPSASLRGPRPVLDVHLPE